MRRNAFSSPYGRVLSAFTLIAFICGHLLSVAWAAKFNRVVDIGQRAPQVEPLLGIDGRKQDFNEFADAKLLVVIFLKNHCPVAQSYVGRINEFVDRFRDQNVKVVGINVSVEQGEELEKMKRFAADQKFSFPYLKDETQRAGRSFGATNTPHVFVLDQQRRIAYMGAIDDNNKPEKVTETYLIDAVKALLNGQEVEIQESLQRGCQITYRE